MSKHLPEYIYIRTYENLFFKNILLTKLVLRVNTLIVLNCQSTLLTKDSDLIAKSMNISLKRKILILQTFCLSTLAMKFQSTKLLQQRLLISICFALCYVALK